MEMYDEDLTVNSFFKRLQADSPVLYDVATRRRWLICVPRQGALGCCEFSDSDFENHILFQEEGHDDYHYFTVNKKELVIKNNVITTKTGFKEERSVPILFEETFFNKNDESHLVLCINQPLEGKTAYGSEPSSKEGRIVLHHIADCADLLFRKHGNVKVATALAEHMHGFIHTLASSERQNLDTVLKETMTFYAKGLQIVMKDHILKRKCQDEDGFYITLKVALESYLMHNVYRELFVQISTCVALKDSRMNKITRNLRDLLLRDLDVRPEFCQNVPKARRELSNLSRYFTPLGKLICLKRVFRVLMQGGSATPTEGTQHMSTDDLLPMVIFLIIKADEGHWWAIFTYITMFRFSKQNTDNEYGFFLATVEAAIVHIASNQIDKYLLSRKVREMSMSYSSEDVINATLWRVQEQQKSQLDSFFQCVFVGDLNGVKALLSEEPSPVTNTATTALLCHPLCDCDKCRKVLEEQEREKEEMRVSLESYDDRGWTALHLAAWCGHVDIIEWLVQSGMDINIKDVQGHTPLHIACMAGQQSSTLLVLHLQANPNTQDNENNTPLHMAALQGHEHCVKALAYYNQGNTALDTEITNDFGDTALHFASKWGYLSICEILVENGAEVSVHNRKNLTPIDVAHNLILMKVLQSRPNPNNPIVLKPQARNLSYQKQRRRSSASIVQDKASAKLTGPSPNNSAKLLSKEKLTNPKIEKLLTAVLNRDLPMIEFYMGWTELGEDVEIPSTSPVTEEKLCHPLCQCAKCAPVQQLRSPAGKDIHINSQNAEGLSQLHVAAQCGYLELCRLFMQRGALVNLATNTQGYTPLHLAVKHQHQEVVHFLLRQKCELDLTDARGNTALHHAAICGSDNILTSLLDYGAMKNIQNAKGNTSLHESSSAGHVTCVQLLIEYGAHVDVKNSNNKTALQLSRSETVRSLFRYASVVTRESQGSNCASLKTTAHRHTVAGLSVSTGNTSQRLGIPVSVFGQNPTETGPATDATAANPRSPENLAYQDSLFTVPGKNDESAHETCAVDKDCPPVNSDIDNETCLVSGTKIQERNYSDTDKNEAGVRSTEVGCGHCSDVSLQTDERSTTDCWVFVPLNDAPSELDQRKHTQYATAQHTDKNSHSSPAGNRPEVVTSSCHSDGDGTFYTEASIEARSENTTRPSSPEKVTGVHTHSRNESLGRLSFKDEYFDWCTNERPHSFGGSGSQTCLTFSVSDKNTNHPSGQNDGNIDNSITDQSTEGIKILPSLEKQAECFQTQTLYAAQTEIKETLSDDESIFKKNPITSNCDSLSEDSRTESEKDLTLD